ncbi:MAG: CheA signal transduction histidine kinase [Labilithrix sp.]|nr:CheA signal transduction histidine kinase [Labilithrix sp.]
MTGDGEDALSRLVLASFVEESAEHARALKREALQLEGATGKARAELLHVLFRTIHTVKGASRAAGVMSVEGASHAMEDLLEQLRASPDTLTPSHVTRLLRFGDVLERVGPELARAGTLAGTDIERDLAELTAPDAAPETASIRSEPQSDESGAIRLSLARVDALIALAADLEETVGRAVTSALEQAGRTAAQNVDARRVGRLSHSMVSAIRELRQLPFSAAAVGLDRVVREAAVATGREVGIEVRGAEIGFDREIVRALREALIHLVRNAVDHGCEAPEERVRKGKKARATIRVEARVRSSDLVVSVEDDGRGFDVEALRRARGEQPGVASDDEIVQTAFVPGVSTAPVVTALSGRGIGLDIVRKRVEDLRGAIAVSFRAGQGTRIALTVPMRRSSVRAVTAVAGRSVVAVPTPAIERLLRVSRESLVISGGRLVVPDPRGPIPVADLAALLGEPPSGDAAAYVLLVVLSSHGRTAAIRVTELLEEREVAVTVLPARLAGARLVTGVTTTSDGRAALVMHTGELIEHATGTAGGLGAAAELATKRGARPTILLADDSVTTRTLERSILEAAGFTVLTAGDGAEAWELLQSRTVDAVVSDVEMPGLDGFELTSRIRGAARFNALPVLLVTGRASEADRRRGLDAGANAYIVKRAFDQELLVATLRRLL